MAWQVVNVMDRDFPPDLKWTIAWIRLTPENKLSGPKVTSQLPPAGRSAVPVLLRGAVGRSNSVSAIRDSAKNLASSYPRPKDTAFNAPEYRVNTALNPTARMDPATTTSSRVNPEGFLRQVKPAVCTIDFNK